SVPYFIWDAVIPTLNEAGFQVLRFDLFGRGFSDRPKIENNKYFFVRQLHDLLTVLKITEPINLIGLSMGGVVAGEFAINFSNKINKLILIDPAGFPLQYSALLKLVKIPLLGEILFSLLGTANLEKSMATDFFDPKLV
ncbi:MAG: alpha/beta hydrolase, partial [Chloroflexota bacterium]